MKRRVLLVAGAAVAVVAVVAAIVLWPEGDTEPTAAPAPREPKPLLQPLEISEQPLWQGPSDVQWAEDHDDAVLFMSGNSNLTLADAKTGATRWTLEKLHDFGGMLLQRTFDSGPGLRQLSASGVLVEYNTADCRRGFCEPGADDEAGVALLSAKDGSVVWRTTVIPAFPGDDVPYENRPQQILRVADERVAVVTVTNGMVHPEYAGGTQRTVAIDVPTGKVLWDKADGVWPMWIVGDTLLGVASPSVPGSGTVVATDLATGEKLWDRPDGALATVAGDVAVVRADEKLTVVKADTGSEVTSFGGSVCRSDRRTVIACLEPQDETEQHNRVTTYDVASGTTTTVAPDVLDLEAVWDGGRVVLRVNSGDDFRYYTVDRNGTVIDKNLDWSNQVVEFTDKRVVLNIDREEPVEVYEVVS